MKIKKIKSEGQVIYPATIAQAIKDVNFPTEGQPMTQGEINSYLRNEIIKVQNKGVSSYLGTISSKQSLSVSAKQGDFYRVNNDAAANWVGVSNVHIGDIILAEKNSPEAAIDGVNWSILHTEYTIALPEDVPVEDSIAAMVLQHEKELYAEDASSGGSEDSDEPTTIVTPVNLQAITTNSGNWQYSGKQTITWSSANPPKLLGVAGASRVSQPFPLENGEILSYHLLRVRSAQYSPVVRMDELPETNEDGDLTWSAYPGTETQATERIIDVTSEENSIGNEISGVWTNNTGHRVYISIVFGEGEVTEDLAPGFSGQFTSEDFDVKIIKMSSSGGNDDSTTDTPSDPPTEETNYGDIVLEEVTGLHATLGSYWNNSGSLQHCNGKQYCVSKRIKVQSGDVVTYSVPISGCGVIVKIDSEESTWALGTKGEIQTTAQSGTWTNNGEDCYISFSYDNTKTNTVTISNPNFSRIATFSLEEESQPSVRKSRITKLEEATNAINSNITSIKNRVSILETSGNGGSSSTATPLPEYGYYGNNHPSEIADILKLKGCPKSYLSFIHISDTHHGGAFYMANADEATEKLGVDFLINTGDVFDMYDVDPTTFISKATAMTKPYYITTGNHEYGTRGTTTVTSSMVYDKFFAPIASHVGITSGKTYYSFVQNGVKCIILDVYETAQPSIGSVASSLSMSKNQVDWFIDELKNAKTNNQTVAIFQHRAFKMDFKDSFSKWNDTLNLSGTYAGAGSEFFLPVIIDAFMEGKSYNFTHSGQSYSGTFSGKGLFAGWFVGHEHCDGIGRVQDYPKQWQSMIVSPIEPATSKYTSIINFNRNACNFVMIIPDYRKVVIYRLGQQDCYGEKRDVVSYIY